MKKKILSLAVMVMISVVSISPASAYFKAEQKPPEINVSNGAQFFTMLSNDVSVVQIGWGDPMKAASQGYDLPLSLALRMLIPADWKISNTTSDPDFMDKKVGWKIDGTWIDGLENIGDGFGSRFLVDWNSKNLFVGGTDQGFAELIAAKKKISLSAGLMKKNAFVEGSITPVKKVDGLIIKNTSSDNEFDSKKKTFTAQKIKFWQLTTGSLQKQLGEWCRKANHQLVWQSSYDWIIDVKSEYRGDFQEVMNTLIEDMQLQESGISAELYIGNSVPVLVIKGN